ncbi:MAG: DNA polymerase III subunit gamma and tau [Propionibacteriaceae bacterium]
MSGQTNRVQHVVDEADVTDGDGLFEAPARPAAAPLALYRRYRPDTFAQVIGQEHVTEPLQRALVNNRVNHAYLFSGPRGCGKTTSARILARALNCIQAPVAEPCGVCDSCRDLARGGPGSIDVIEIDAASHGGVDDARDLRERAFFSPVSSRYKIYIVDEAHMVTTAGFNALLKVVEEPPPHVKFIFATTEPEKVIGTIRSRTHHYPFRLVPPRVLTGYLSELCEAEGIAVEPAVLPLVVRAGAGSVRDSLSVLDQLLGGAADSGVSYAQASALLGYTPDSLLDEVVDAFAAGDAGGVFACVDKVIEVGQDPRRFAEDLLRRIRDLVIVAAVPDALQSGLVEVSGDQAERLASQAASLGAGELTRAAEVIASGLTEMRGTTAPRLHLELMCARVLLPGADVDHRGVHARLDRLERRIGMTDVAPAGPTAPPSDAVRPRTARSEPTASGPEPMTPHPEPRTDPGDGSAETPVGPQDRSGSDTTDDHGGVVAEPSGGGVDKPGSSMGPDDGPPAEAPATSSPPRPAAPGPAAPTGFASAPAAVPARSTPDAPRPTGLSVTEVRRLWPEVLAEVSARRKFTWILLSQEAQVTDVSDGTLILGMSEGGRTNFARGGSEDILHEALIEVLGTDLKIEAIIDANAGGGGGRRRPPAKDEAVPAPVSDRGWPDLPTPGSPGSGSAGPDAPAPGPPAPGPPAPGPVEPAPGSPPVPTPAAPVRPEIREQIRPTRHAGRAAEAPEAAPSDETDADRNDTDLDESVESHTELLQRHLGVEIIAEEEHR